MRIEDTLAKMVLKTQPVEELPGMATDALCEGLDSPALRVLAVSSRVEHPDDLWQLLRKAAQELGIAVPDRLQAARRVLRLHLRDIAEQRVPPAEGVGRIINDVQHPVGHEFDKSHVGEALGIGRLVGAYHTYDDASSGRLEFEGRRVSKEEAFEILDSSIIQEARKLLREAEPIASPNGGPGTRSGNSGVTEGPPSVS
jgi:hypothetical protein